MWQVLVVEDDPHMRAFFVESVSRCGQLQLVGCVSTVADAFAFLDGVSRPIDVLLVDLGLPDGSGLEVIRHAKVRYPQCEPLVISMFGDEDNVLASIEAGALGYIHKDAAPEDIAQTILDMKGGASPISPMIARRVLFKYAAMSSQKTPAGPVIQAAQTVALSKREQTALELIARGFSYAEIARLNGVSVHTVQSQIKTLYGKLAVHSKNEAVFEATRMGLLSQQHFHQSS